MWSTAREIAAGDVVIVWMTREQLLPLVVTPGKELNNRFGYYHHADWVGIPYGSKVGSRNGKGFIYLLRPTPELWTLALPHRTQILYVADIAFVTSWLNIRPGSKVIEAGTGSGSFSHSTARTIGPKGHLYSYEFHEARATKAREEFERHGMSNVTLNHRNVCKDGFTVTNMVDAVFLDLPAPWEAVEYAKSAMRKDRATRICCFSPCIEQVLRTVSALNEHGFSDITMYETLLRPQDISAPPPPVSISVIAERLRVAEHRREDKRQAQIAQSRARHAVQTGQAGPSREKRKRVDVDSIAPTLEGADGASEDNDVKGIDTKRARTETAATRAALDDGALGGGHNGTISSGSTAPSITESNSVPIVVHEPVASDAFIVDSITAEMVEPTLPAPHLTRKRQNVLPVGEEPARRATVSKSFADVRGHTSYLTFAVFFPSPCEVNDTVEVSDRENYTVVG